MNYRARYYHPALGRFVSADTVVPSPGDPQSLNRYAYVQNNPLKYTDPSGHRLRPPPTWEINISGHSKGIVNVLRVALFVLGGQTSVEEDALKVYPSMAIPFGADFIVAVPAPAIASRLADVADDTAVQLTDDAAVAATQASESKATIVYDGRVGRYRNLDTGRFIAERDLPYPPNGGFASSSIGTVEAGTVVDRYGPPTGRYVGQPGATISERGLVPGSEARGYHKYEVLRPIENTRIGPAAPVSIFGARGGAIQYCFRDSIEALVRQA